MNKGYVNTSEGQIHYRCAVRPDKPVLVLLHQTASSSAMYELVMARLADTYSMYALDTPGFGGSYRLASQPTIATYTKGLLEAIETLGLTQFHLFGHHTGSAIACDMAVQAPERVQSLMLCGPPHYGSREHRAQREARIVKPFVIDPDGDLLQQVWQRVGGNAPGRTLALALREAVDTLHAGEQWPFAYHAVFAYHFEESLARVSCPLLLACGRDDMLWPYFGGACAARPDAKAVELPGDSFVIEEYPDLVASMIDEFIAGVTQKS